MKLEGILMLAKCVMWLWHDAAGNTLFLVYHDWRKYLVNVL